MASGGNIASMPDDAEHYPDDEDLEAICVPELYLASQVDWHATMAILAAIDRGELSVEEAVAAFREIAQRR